MDWVPLVEMAHLVNSIRTRSALVSMMMVSFLHLADGAYTPPMVVISSPTASSERILAAAFFFLFSGRMSRK